MFPRGGTAGRVKTYDGAGGLAMYCDRCGVLLSAGAQYCGACGKAVAPGLGGAAGAGSATVGQSGGAATGRGRKHIQLLAVLWVAWGVLRLLAGGRVLLVGS